MSKNVMFRFALQTGAILTLVACGGGARNAAPVADIPAVEINENTPRFANGPIAVACLQQDLSEVSTRRCGCVQAAANLTLSQPQQQRGVQFFNAPEKLQDVKMSDTAANERFWASWASFSETAEKLCKDV